MVRIVIIAALVALQILFGIPGFMHGGPYLERALLYSFFHANWLHLAVNCIAVWTVYDPKRKPRPCRDLIFPFLIAVLVYPLSFRPVIGFSNVIYAAIGMRTPPVRSRWWRQPSVLIFLAVTVALVFVPQFSATTHIAAFALGMAYASVHRFYLEATEDARRYL